MRRSDSYLQVEVQAENEIIAVLAIIFDAKTLAVDFLLYSFRKWL